MSWVSCPSAVRALIWRHSISRCISMDHCLYSRHSSSQASTTAVVPSDLWSLLSPPVAPVAAASESLSPVALHAAGVGHHCTHRRSRWARSSPSRTCLAQ
uniref:Uncharacterized protein n=1 Tax=Sphaerodactylus townsendi TaxID=933632 RepID=A0ACB8F159_9SAUR